MFKIFSQTDEFGPTGLFTVQCLTFNSKTHTKDVAYTAVNLDENSTVRLLGKTDTVILGSGAIPFAISAVSTGI